MSSVSDDPLAFLKVKAIFGDLIHSKRFVSTYLLLINCLRKYGVEKTIRDLDQLLNQIDYTGIRSKT